MLSTNTMVQSLSSSGTKFLNSSISSGHQNYRRTGKSFLFWFTLVMKFIDDTHTHNWDSIIGILIRLRAHPSGRVVYGVGVRPLACWDCGFESHRRHECLSLVSVVCWQVEVSATGRSLVQRSPTDCGVSECDREASIMRRPWPTRDYWATTRAGGGLGYGLENRPEARGLSLLQNVGYWPSLGPTQPPIQWVLMVLSPGQSGRSVKLIIYLNLISGSSAQG
jgi:hypothetical protein